MKTDDLIDLLSTNVEPVPRRRVGWMLGGAIAVSAAAAVAAMVLALGVRPDMAGPTALTALVLKLGFTLAILIPASIYLLRLARPGGERKTPIGLAALPFAVIMLVALVHLAFAPVSHWNHMVTGRDWLECLLSIPIIAIVPPYQSATNGIESSTQ